MSEAIEHSCVLVVDDEASIRDTLIEVIEAIGCSAVAAADGREALAMLETRRPCLVILDLIMPELSGLEILAEMRKRARMADVPVLISTSAPHLAPRDLPILPKPIDVKRMWEHIRGVCHCDEAGS